MKRILFYTENFCDSTSKGGLEVATFRIAKSLKDSGKWEVLHAFRKKADGKKKSIYCDVIKLPGLPATFEKNLANFITENRIDVVVNMSRFFRDKSISKAVKSTGMDVKTIFMQHFAPGSEMKKPTFASGMHLLKLNPFNPAYWLRVSFYPLLKLPRRIKFNKIYESTYQNNDRIILLSDGYIEDYCKIGGFDDNSKFKAIPNIFETDEKKDFKEKKDLIAGKKKQILILSRMDEIQKRMSLALKIWSEIEKDPEFKDWHLDIVGSGHNTDIVKRLIRKLNLNNVIYHGWKNREQFLKESSILMTTSAYEGLPLSILEAQAYGCVPIAFNSYASLKDVVEDGVNGVIVDRFGDIPEYAHKLKELMRNEDKRTQMAENAMENVKRYSSEKIGNQWLRMLETL